MMKAMKMNRFLVVLLSVVMVIGVIPSIPLTAYADPPTEADVALTDYDVTADYDMAMADGKLIDKAGDFDAPLTGLASSDFSNVEGDDILTFPNSAGDRYAKLPDGIIYDEYFAVEATYSSAAANANALIWNLGTRRAANNQPQTLNNFFNAFANVSGKAQVTIKDGSLYDGERTVSGGAVDLNQFTTVVTVFEAGKVSVYQDGALIGTVDSGYSIQDILDVGVSNPTDAIGYIGRAFSTTSATANNFRGALTSFKVYNKAFTATDRLDKAADRLIIQNANDVRGNITLLDEIMGGVKIEWTSSNEAVVNTKVKEVTDYDDIPAGVVTRPADADANVTLTAKLTYDGEEKEKSFNLTVKKAPAPIVPDKYLFTHFTGDEGNANAEQVYFALSDDGLNFRDMSAVNDPILTSTVGEKGVRDMCLIRSAEGDRFYLIATDLSIYYRARGWGTGNNASTTGSQKIVVWESTDLVNWSDPYLARVAPDAAGMAWAPEGYYDEKTGEYIVFWSSTMNGRTQVYYAKTRDFHSFTEAKPFVEHTDVIDASVTEVGDYYYRASKYGGNGASNIFLQRVSKADGLLGTWADYISLAGAKNTSTNPPATPNATGYYGTGGPALEGPEFYHLANGDVILMADRFGNGGGYQPFLIEDIEDFSSWSTMAGGTFNYGAVKKRHGNILPITTAEYTRMLEAYTDGYVTGVSLDKSELDVFVGGSKALIATLIPANPVSNEVTWTSSDESIATVSSLGNVSGIKQGTATITVKTKDGDFTANCTVTVSPPPEKATPIAYFDFNAPAVSNVFSSVEGTDAKATAQGANSTYLDVRAKGAGYDSGDTALYLAGTTAAGRNTAFLRVTDLAGNPLLTGKNEITISYDANPNRSGTHWPIFLSASTAANAESNLNYIGFFNAPSTTTLERFKTSRTGPSASANTGAINTWNHVDVVLTPTATKMYVNGVLQNEVSASAAQAVSNIIGNNSNFQIGRAQWGTNGEFFNGLMDNVAVYDRELLPSEIKRIYYETTSTTNVLAAIGSDIANISVPGVAISDIDLPKTGASGSKIEWASSDESAIAADGTVVRPDSSDLAVTLTATVTLAGQSVPKDFDVSVLAAGDEATLNYLVSNYDLGIQYVTDDITLAKTLGFGSAVTWTSSDDNLITASGNVTRPEAGEGDKVVTLTAEFSVNAAKVTKSFDVTVAEEDYGSLLTYVRTTTPELTYAMYLAAKTSSETKFTELNSGKPVRYAKLGAKRMQMPSVFRKSDGTFGAIAANNNTGDSVLLFDSKDLIDYTGERLLRINNDGLAVSEPFAVYDNAIRAYRITWRNGSNYYETVTDLTSIISVTKSTAPTRTVVGTAPTGSAQQTQIGVTKAEYAKVVKKFSRIVNTDVENFAEVAVSDSAQVAAGLPDRAKLTYSDGSSKYLGVEWDASDIAKIKKSGTYEIDGTVIQKTYGDPYIKYRADPYVTKGDGLGTNDDYYYFTASYPRVGNHTTTVPADGGYDRVVLRRSKTLEGLADVGQNVYANTDNAENQEIVIWNQADSTSDFRNVWAPEIHKIDGRWYVLFTTSNTSSDQYGVRCAIIGCYGDGDPFKPENWKAANPEQTNQAAATRFQPVSGDQVAAMGNAVPFNQFSLDMTYFEHNGTHYVVWAQKPSSSNLLIASINPAKPWELTSNAQLISVPDYPWEINTGQSQRVDEGAAFMAYGDKVFIAFSGSTVDARYCIGLLSADKDADLLDPESWTKSAYPALSTEDLIDQAGPGHNSFTVDEFGNPIIVYHARTPGDIAAPVTGGNAAAATDGGLGDPRRHARIKPVHFTADGDIYYSMRPEEELDPANKAVKITVRVTGADTAALEVAVKVAELYADREYSTSKTAWDEFTKVLDGAKAIIAKPGDYTTDEATAASGDLAAAMKAVDDDYVDSLLLSVWVEIAEDMINEPEYAAKHTKSSWAAFEGALAAAKAVLDSRISQKAIDDALQALADATDTLYEKGDATDLNTLVSSINSNLKESDWTAETWAKLTKALSVADAVLTLAADDDASIYQVEYAMDVLWAAVDGLQAKPPALNFMSLDSAILTAQGIVANASQYVATSITGLPTAITVAQGVRTSATTQAQINAATTALAREIAKARKKADLSSLEALLGNVTGLNLSLYTPYSVAQLAAAANEGADLVAKKDSISVDSQSAVNAAYDRLLAALNALVAVTNTGNVDGNGAAGTGDGEAAGVGAIAPAATNVITDGAATVADPRTPLADSSATDNSGKTIPSDKAPLASSADDGNSLLWILAAVAGALVVCALFIFIVLGKRRRKAQEE